MEKLMYRIPEAAHVLGLGRTVVYAEMAAGRIQFVRRGRSRLVSAQALIDYVALLEAETAGV